MRLYPRTRKSLLHSGIFIALSVLSAFPMRAADTAAELTGTVKDTSGAVISNATLTLVNTATQQTLSQKAHGDGSYVFSGLSIGTYQLRVRANGFNTSVQDKITLSVNQHGRLDVTLNVSASEETVEVNADVSQVDTEGATLGSVETTRRIDDLPLVERDTFQLGLLQAGVYSPDPDDGSGNPFSVSGQRSESLTFLIDGSDNNNFLGNNDVVDPNPDAVGEFKILTNNYTAEFGRTSGGIVNQAIKYGTNSFHGDVFEFFRNDALNARNYFQLTNPPYKRNIFGGTVGGPIKRDKLFFFTSYQGTIRHEGENLAQQSVLSPAQRTGDFSSDLTGSTPVQILDPISGNPYPNNQVPVNPIIATYIAKYVPLPNIPGTDLFASSPVEDQTENQGISRVDWQLSKKDLIYGTYIIDELSENIPILIENGASAGGTLPVGSGSASDYHNQFLTGHWTRTISSNLLNELIFSYNRAYSLVSVPTDHTSPSQLGFTNVTPDDPAGVAPPIMYTADFTTGPPPGGPTTYADRTFQLQDTFSWLHGKHQLKFGADVRVIRNDFDFDFYNNGSFDFSLYIATLTGDPMADFVGGFPDNYYQFSNARYGIRTQSYYFFGQDTYKVTPRLSLSYGLRYEYNTPQQDPHNNIIGYFPGSQSTIYPDAPPDLLYPGDPGTPNKGMVYPDRNNFAPRFAFAYDTFGNGKLVLRGGFGIFYDIEDGALNLQFGGQPPFGAVENISPTQTNYSALAAGTNVMTDPYTPFGLVNPYPTNDKIVGFGVPKIPFAYAVYPHFRTPYSENINLGYQYQLTRSTMLEMDYVSTLGRKSVASYDLNHPDQSLLEGQYASYGSTYADCARPLAVCTDPDFPDQTPAEAAVDPDASPTQTLQLLTDLSNGSSSNNELQVTVDHQLAKGLNVRGAYTLGKTIDLTSGFRARSSTYTDPYNFAFDRGPADFDVHQRAVISGFYEIPGLNSGWVRLLTNNWQAGGIATFQTGTPFTLFSGNNSSGQGTNLDRPELVGPVPRLEVSKPGHYLYDTTNLLTNVVAPGDDSPGVPMFTFGNLGRNTFRTPGINNFDLSFLKRFTLGEQRRLEFRTELFNAFNHTQWLFNKANNLATSSTYDQVTQARDPRLIQFALKFYY
jgi:Carboxypeptidase regulatory-like domain